MAQVNGQAYMLRVNIKVHVQGPQKMLCIKRRFSVRRQIFFGPSAAASVQLRQPAFLLFGEILSLYEEIPFRGVHFSSVTKDTFFGVKGNCVRHVYCVQRRFPWNRTTLILYFTYIYTGLQYVTKIFTVQLLNFLQNTKSEQRILVEP